MCLVSFSSTLQLWHGKVTHALQTQGSWYVMLVLCKAKGPTCSCPSPRNMKPEKRMQGRGRRGEERRDGGLEREKKLAREAGDEKWEQENEQAKEPWNTRLSNVMSLGDTWSLWHSIWESPEAALPETTGFLRCTGGHVWVPLEPCQCPWRD